MAKSLHTRHRRNQPETLNFSGKLVTAVNGWTKLMSEQIIRDTAAAEQPSWV